MLTVSVFIDKLGPMLVMPLVSNALASSASKPSGKSSASMTATASSSSSNSATSASANNIGSPPSPPSPGTTHSETAEMPAAPVMLLILNAAPLRSASYAPAAISTDAIEEDDAPTPPSVDELQVDGLGAASTATSASAPVSAGTSTGTGGGGDSPSTPTASGQLPLKASHATTGFQRALNLPASNSKLSSHHPDTGSSEQHNDPQEQKTLTRLSTASHLSSSILTSSGASTDHLQTPTATVRGGKGKEGTADALFSRHHPQESSSAQQRAHEENEALQETQLWTALYASAKAMAKVLAPALAACGPALRPSGGPSGL